MVQAPHQSHPPNVMSTASNRPYEQTASEFNGVELYEVVKATKQPVRLTQDELGHDQRWKTLGKVALAIPIVSGWLAAPLVGRNGKNIGLLQLADKVEGEFTADDEAILVQLSRLAAIAIENATLYDELRANDQRKDEFLAMLAHELRNPLAAISNAVNVTRRTGLKEHIDWSIDVITRQMNHLTRLIDDLLDVSRINRGMIELRKDLLDATPILDSAAATVRPLVDERKHTLEVSIESGNLWVNADPTRLEQVVVNLLNNAAKYSEDGGHIHLLARNDGGDVVIIVRDRGVGIPPDKLSGMFELFAQGDRSLARSEGGLGIGLTIVKKLVEMHGGTIVARSEGVGKGSEFTIRLPAAKRPALPGSKVSGLTETANKKARVLVVDDNVDTAHGMERLLKLIGHETARAHDGNEALQVACEFRPEIILLDIGLPGMDGYEVAARMRREEWCKNAVIVAVSGYGQDEDRRRSMEAGFDHHLIKPLDHDALLLLISPAGTRSA
jgi:signal transduction histidine kinase/ActR/RegA family two-component response regulator